MPFHVLICRPETIHYSSQFVIAPVTSDAIFRFKGAKHRHTKNRKIQNCEFSAHVCRNTCKHMLRHL